MLEGFFLQPFLLKSVINHKAANGCGIGLGFGPLIHEKANEYMVFINGIGVYFGVVFCFRDGNRVAAGASLAVCAHAILVGCQFADVQ